MARCGGCSRSRCRRTRVCWRCWRPAATTSTTRSICCRPSTRRPSRRSSASFTSTRSLRPDSSCRRHHQLLLAARRRFRGWTPLTVRLPRTSKDDSSLDALLRPPKPASFSLKKSASFCLKKSSASLLLCTEGLGSESTVDSDDMVKGDGGDAALSPGKEATAEEGQATFGDAGTWLLGGSKDKEPPSFPPPIRSIGRGGKPCVCFRTSREDGRFVLTQVVIPGKELLHASREGGRLRLRFANAAAATGDEDGEEPELGDEEDRELESNTTCIGACA